MVFMFAGDLLIGARVWRATALLKTLAITVALLFLLGAVLTAVTDLFGSTALAAEPPRQDAGVEFRPAERTYFNATKSGPLPRPRPRDAGQPVYFPASKSFGGESLPGINQQLKQLREPTPQQAPQQQAP
jgi:hypothetical protein